MKLFHQFSPEIDSLIIEAARKWADLPPTSSVFAMLAQSLLHDSRTRFFFQAAVGEMLLLTDREAQDFAVEVINRAFEGAAAATEPADNIFH